MNTKDKYIVIEKNAEYAIYLQEYNVRIATFSTGTKQNAEEIAAIIQEHGNLQSELTQLRSDHARLKGEYLGTMKRLRGNPDIDGESKVFIEPIIKKLEAE